MGKVETRPGAARAHSVADVHIIEAIATWCEALQGRSSLRDALKRLLECLGADAVALTYQDISGRGTAGRIAYDSKEGAPGHVPITRSYAAAVLGRYSDAARPGTIWLASFDGEDGAPAAMHFLEKRKLKELVVLPLAVTADSCEALEIFLPRPCDAQIRTALNMISTTLTTTWARRATGISEMAMETAFGARKRDESGPILGLDNPAGLSRAEFRVCHLLSRGLSNKALLTELGITESTLRTHLRHIYEKTGVGCHRELLYQLLSAAPLRSHPVASQAA